MSGRCRHDPVMNVPVSSDSVLSPRSGTAEGLGHPRRDWTPGYFLRLLWELPAIYWERGLVDLSGFESRSPRTRHGFSFGTRHVLPLDMASEEEGA